MVKCGSADVDTCKMRINYADFCCGFTGKMRMCLRIFLCAIYSAEAGLLLRTEDCMPTL